MSDKSAAHSDSCDPHRSLSSTAPVTPRKPHWVRFVTSLKLLFAYTSIMHELAREVLRHLDI